MRKRVVNVAEEKYLLYSLHMRAKYPRGRQAQSL